MNKILGLMFGNKIGQLLTIATFVTVVMCVTSISAM